MDRLEGKIFDNLYLLLSLARDCARRVRFNGIGTDKT